MWALHYCNNGLLGIWRGSNNNGIDQAMLRSHLGECFMKGHLQPFLTIKNEEKQKVMNSHVPAIYCTCRLPDNYGSIMIQCDNCENWFHTVCTNTDTLLQ